MESELLKQRAKSSLAGGNNRYSPPTNSERPTAIPTADAQINSVPVVPVNQSNAPVTDVATTESPNVPAQQIDPKTFSLQTAQNGTTVPYTPLNAINAPYQPVPVWNVPPTLTGSVPANNFPVRNISPTNPNRGTFGYIIRAGAGIALSGSGLHCPICRVMGGLH